VLAVQPAQLGDILLEHGSHHLQASADGQRRRRSLAAPAISVIDTITCSGTLISPASGAG